MSVATSSSPALQHILLVEDESGHVRLIREALGYHANLYLHAVTDAVRAIHFLTRREEFRDAPSPSLIILDLNLPIFSGKSLLEERRRRNLITAPVVVLTSSSRDQTDCLVLGATGFHLKPDDWNGWQGLMRHLALKYLQVDLDA